MKPSDFFAESGEGFDEVLSPKQFLKLCSEGRDRIKRVRFLMPRVGPGQFGSFAVEYKEPEKVGK